MVVLSNLLYDDLIVSSAVKKQQHGKYLRLIFLVQAKPIQKKQLVRLRKHLVKRQQFFQIELVVFLLENNVSLP